MKRNRQRIWAVLVMLALVLASCESSHPEIVIKMKPDHSQIISEIRGVNATLAEKLADIEKKMADGFADNAAALAAIKTAVASLEGTTAEKLAAIETAVKAQTTSLETKLALVEAAVEAGFADSATAQGLIKDAIAALEGSATEKFAAIEAAVKAQSTSLETKLGLIEKAVETGFADNAAAQGLIKDAITALEGTAAEKLAAIEKAVSSQTASLETKLAAIEKAVKEGFATSAQAQELIKSAIASLQGSMEDKFAAIEKAMTDPTSSLLTKLSAIEAAINKGFADSAKAQGLIEQAIKTLDSNTAGKLAEILQKITGLPNYSGDLDDIKNAIDTLRKMFVLSVSLDKAALTLYVGARVALTATVFPDDATDKSVTWKSSDATVAEVSMDGTVAARKAGTATITVTTVVGGNTATCEVTVKDQEYVDLGFKVNGKSIKWATMNVGANAPEEYGDYFAWGETEPKSDYTWSTYKYANGSNNTLTKYNTNSSYGSVVDNKTTLDLEDDAARANWGGTWRMPTSEELKALRDNCTSEWTTQGGVNGREFKSNINGNKIFLPAAGWWGGDIRINDGSYGFYWSSSLDTGRPYGAWSLYFSSGGADAGGGNRFDGQSVRPVTD